MIRRNAVTNEMTNGTNETPSYGLLSTLILFRRRASVVADFSGNKTAPQQSLLTLMPGLM